MHEASLVEELFDHVDRAVAPRAPEAVRLVTVRIGEYAGVERELFETAFGAAREARGYARASLAVVEAPGAGEILLLRVELEVPDV